MNREQAASSDRLLGAATSAELPHRLSLHPILVLPIGSCEQHGPHLPLFTDTVIAEALCAALAGVCDDVMIGPSIPIGNSGEHQGFPGTLSVSNQALGAYLLEIGRSAVSTVERPADFSAILFVSGHGGNSAALAAVVARLRGEGRSAAWWCPSDPTGDAHAGATETSAMLAIAPEVVRVNELERGATAPLPTLIDAIRDSGVRSVSANGVLGDPRSASAEHGHVLVERWTRELLEVALRLSTEAAGAR